MLKAYLFRAQVEFQRGAFLDADKDGRGDFAPEIAFLAGKTTATMSIPQNLIASKFNVSQPVLSSGYRFATYTFGDAGKNFVAYAWPDRLENGYWAFAVTNTGVLYNRRWTAHDQPLTTFALWGGSEVALGEVEPDPAWKQYYR